MSLDYRSFLVTAPTAEPIDLDDAKRHLRVDHSDDDELIGALIPAARLYVENATERALMTQTWDMKRDAFPSSGCAIRLFKPPVSAVTSIVYVDADGVSQTWDSSNYRTSLPTGPFCQRGQIEPTYGVSWPETRPVSDAVTVKCVHGYGAASAVPEALVQAMYLLIGHWYENREAVNTTIGANVSTVPMAVDALLAPFKAY